MIENWSESAKYVMASKLFHSCLLSQNAHIFLLEQDLSKTCTDGGFSLPIDDTFELLSISATNDVQLRQY